ncbi:MAG TPA: amidohydrolase [Flavitalea sp.]|nr:amidohydrolase [Flavitalea sp.]
MQHKHFWFALLLPIAGYSQKTTSDIIAKKASAILPSVIEWRRDFHQHPELSNQEFKTSAKIATFLRSLGLEVQTGVARTGVVALLKGSAPGPVLAIRADMDALPIREQTGLPFASTSRALLGSDSVPVMHACGHDAHMAILMGTASILASMKDRLHGTVKFIFQPAEEGTAGDSTGGALLMVNEGVMENPKVDAIIGLHIKSEVPSGTLRYKAGSFMAAADWFDITVKGKGAHGSTPWNGIDPITIAAQIINSLQTIVSRQEDIVHSPVVISVGQFNAGVRENIIPDNAFFKGTIRTFSPQVQADVHEKVSKMAKSIAASWGAEADVHFNTKTLITYNDSALTSSMLNALYNAAGKDRVSMAEWGTVAEDFSYYGTKAPSFFFNLGGMMPGTDPAKATGHHTSTFLIDDNKLDIGIRAFCEMAVSYLK